MKPEFDEDLLDEFENFLCDRNDAIYAAVHDLFEAITGKEQPDDVYYLGELADIAEGHWGNMGIHTCFPSYIGDDEVPCFLEGSCDNPDCPMKAVRP